MDSVEPDDFEDIQDQQLIDDEAGRIVRAIQAGEYDEQQGTRAISDFVKHRPVLAVRSLGRSMGQKILDYPKNDPDWTVGFVAEFLDTTLPPLITARYDPDLDENRT
ncbi:hypothetical protein QFZ36_000519 [Pseudarthrobacter siccitolerans]|uniref:Uncharacterized protein n=1 Tax=Pseudarthrobacter siccitolerans TaxID=861266 RepID=A0ABU0PG64_9MICC|nr:hypothetical protein [Pseudarthrobacter siccitolerans]MDQ0672958.1 hypothetical protein [Pseudarthrobacter siccitolerans]